MADDEFLSFAYGSNMLANRLQKRTPSAKVHAIGYIEGHVLVFDKRSIDGSGKGNIRATGKAADRVYGVVFNIKKSEKGDLDRAEGLNNGYREDTVRVVTADGTIDVQAYIGTDLDAARKPYQWYKALILGGGRQNNLPADYVEQLVRIEAIADPKPDRSSKREAEAALVGTGIDPDAPA